MNEPPKTTEELNAAQEKRELLQNFRHLAITAFGILFIIVVIAATLIWIMKQHP